MSTNKTHQHIAAKLKEYRLKNNLTQEQLAESAGINTNSYAKIERNEQNTTIDSLQKLCKALKIKSKDVLPF